MAPEDSGTGKEIHHQISLRFRRLLDWLSSKRHLLRSPAAIGYLITILGAAITAFSLADSASKLNKIEAKLSTRYVAPFPDNMDAIIEVLRSAKKEIAILVDVANYGILSRHNKFNEYIDLLKSKRRAGIVVTIASYDCETYKRIIGDLLMKGAPPEMRDNGNYKPYVACLKSDESFSDFWDSTDNPNESETTTSPVDGSLQLRLRSKDNITTLAHLVERLNYKDHDIKQDLKTIRLRVNQPLPVHCWIVDGQEAVYSFLFDPFLGKDMDTEIQHSESESPSAESAAGESLIQSCEVYEAYQASLPEMTFRTFDKALLQKLKAIMHMYAPDLVIDGKRKKKE